MQTFQPKYWMFDYFEDSQGAEAVPTLAKSQHFPNAPSRGFELGGTRQVHLQPAGSRDQADRDPRATVLLNPIPAGV